MNFKQNEAFLNPPYNLGSINDQMMNNRTPNIPGMNDFNPMNFNPNAFSHQMNQMPSNTPQTHSNSQDRDGQEAAETAYPAYDRNINYYHEFWRMYLQNEVLITSMKDHVMKTKELQARTAQLEAQCHELELNLLSNIKKESMKKKRRTANEIEKAFDCPYENCQRSYGSDVSLNLHIKLKHGGGNKTERDKLAKAIIEAKLKNEDLPQISLNFPPGFFEKLDITKLSKIKKDKGDAESIKESANLKKLLQENNIDENQLLELLDEFNRRGEGDKVEKKHKSDGPRKDNNSDAEEDDEIYEESSNKSQAE